MGFSKGNSKSNSSSSGGFNQGIYPVQGGALEQLYGNAGDLFGQTTSGMQGQLPGATDYMNQIAQGAQPAWQQQLGGGAYDGINSGDVLSSIQQSMGQPSNTSSIYANVMGGEGNNYADAMRDQYVNDATRAQENMLANLDARAAASGMSGGSRHGIATAQGMEDINRNLQRNMAEIGYNTFDKDLANKLSIAQQADSNTLSRQNMMMDMLAGKQAAMTGGIGAGGMVQNLGMGAMNPYMMPWNAAGMYGNVIGRPTVLNQLGMSGGSKSGSKGFGIGF